MADVTTGRRPEATPRVSVIVCTYRREESLRLLLGDLLAQEGVAAEIIVVDQTPQHEPETDALLEREGERIRHLRIGEPNLPNARNRGIDLARGEIVVFLDDDLRVRPHFLRSLVAHFEDPGVDGVAPLVVQDDGQLLGGDARYRFPRGWRDQVRIPVSDYIAGACMAYRLALVRELGGFDPLLGRLNPTASGEDAEFCGRWLRTGHRLWLAPGVQALHLAFTPGGCATRFHPADESSRMHRRAFVYLVLKQERSFERICVRAWLRLLRGTVVRRDVLRAGPAAWRRAFRALLESLAEVRAFWREHSGTAGQDRAARDLTQPHGS